MQIRESATGKQSRGVGKGVFTSKNNMVSFGCNRVGVYWVGSFDPERLVELRKRGSQEIGSMAVTGQINCTDFSGSGESGNTLCRKKERLKIIKGKRFLMWG